MFKKGLVVIAVPFLFQIVFIAALWRAQRDSAEAQSWAIHTKDVIAQTEAVARFMTEAQNDARGRIVTGEASQSAAYARASARVPGALAKLGDLVGDNPTQQGRVGALKARIDAFMDRLDATHRLAASGRAAEAVALVGQTVKAGTAEAIRAQIDGFLAEEERLDRLRREALGRTWQRQNSAIAAGAVVSVLVAVIMMTAFSRGFAQRVAVLGDNARRLAEGEALAAPIGGGDELSRLDAVFHAMAASLAEKDRENEMFIFSVSHDLRSPLVNLQGFSRELALTCDDLRQALARGGVDEATRARVDVLLDRDMGASIRFIQSAVTRLSAIIDALLRLSRAGRVEYRMQAVDVAASVARVVEALGATAAERKAEVAVADALPPAWGDPTAVEQVFANLIGNALNYLDPGRPGRVEVGAAEPPEPERKAHPNLVTYYVKDNGLGIPRAYQAKVFMAFQRLHPDAAPGEGVGLALVRRVVERHGGKVWFQSEVGCGTTFYLTLPAPPEAGSGPGPASERAAGGAAGGQGQGQGQGHGQGPTGARVWQPTR